MGVNLVPEVRVPGMLIVEREFIEHGTPPQTPIQDALGHVEDGCTTYGLHKILKFAINVTNIGTEDLVIGSPSRDDLFKDSSVHGRIFKYPFFKYSLRDNSGKEYVMLKHPWCLSDDPNRCHDQRIRKNRSDTYRQDHNCQFIEVDGIEDGDYVFEAIINFFSVERKKKGESGVIIEEDEYKDNTIQIPINITGDKIKEITQNPNNRPPNNRLQP
jgi:hypothetical protein